MLRKASATNFRAQTSHRNGANDDAPPLTYPSTAIRQVPSGRGGPGALAGPPPLLPPRPLIQEHIRADGHGYDDVGHAVAVHVVDHHVRPDPGSVVHELRNELRPPGACDSAA